jgi:hypothetical protein
MGRMSDGTAAERIGRQASRAGRAVRSVAKAGGLAGRQDLEDHLIDADEEDGEDGVGYDPAGLAEEEAGVPLPVDGKAPIERYRAIERRIRGAAAPDINREPEELTPTEIVAWFAGRRPDFRTPTFRKYKCSLRQAWLADLPEGWEDGVRALDETSSKGTRQAGKDGRCTKAKKLPPADLALLLAWLRDRRAGSFHAQRTEIMLLCTLHTGLRPGEWARAWLEEDGEDEDRIVLAVDTLKARNGHGKRHVRRLDVSGLPAEVLAGIRQMIVIAQGEARQGRHDAMLAGCQQVMLRANAELWPRRLTRYALSSARHQFAANAKAQLPPATVSALMGHAATRTAVQSYGKRRHAWVENAQGGVPNAALKEAKLGGEVALRLPVPDRASLEAVRDTLRRDRYGPEGED